MSLRSLCPSFLYPLLQKGRALPDLIRFARYKKRYTPNPKGIVMISPSRRELSGNFAFIANALQDSEFTLTLLCEGDGKSRDQQLKILAQNGIVLLDDHTPWIYPLTFANTTKVVQVWHSTGAFKRMGFARMGRRGSTKPHSLTHRNYTHVIVSAKSVVPAFCEAFGLTEDKIYPIGVPRTDLFFDAETIQQMTEAFYQEYPRLQGKKLVLFAPTFRGDTRGDAHYPKEWFDPAAFLDALPEDYVLGLKLHPFIEEKMPIPAGYEHRIIDFSHLREINPLLFVTHTLITDYSSVIFEYALLNKPIVFYLPDLAQYDRDRSFFYDFETYVYGARCHEKSELPAAVLNPQEGLQNRDLFMERFLGSCDGASTRRFVDGILRGKPL